MSRRGSKMSMNRAESAGPVQREAVRLVTILAKSEPNVKLLFCRRKPGSPGRSLIPLPGGQTIGCAICLSHLWFQVSSFRCQ